ncbi:hypothetical protein Q1695_014172 [Nippostrongylus brasiliensis]|nr:hypothetical protein Q1695_014172 [Nippostrongylus brasiliensis]
MIQVCREPTPMLAPRADEPQDRPLKVETSDSFKIERPQPKYADGRRTSAPAILWSAANLIDDKPTTSTVDSISLLQRLLERQRVLASQMTHETASPDSGIGLDHPMDSTDVHCLEPPVIQPPPAPPTIPSMMAANRNPLTATSHPTLPTPFLWPWING